MHVVFVHRGSLPERVGGTYSYIYELGRGMAARGHQVDVIAATRKQVAPPPFDLEGATVHTYTYRRVNPVYSTLQHLRRTEELFRRIHEKRPVDVLSIHDTHLGLRTARSRSGRAVCQIPTYHAPVFLEYRFNTAWRMETERSLLKRTLMRVTEPPLEHWQRRFEEGVLQAADGVVVLSEYSKGHVRNLFPSVDLTKVRVIQGGVDTDRFAPARDKMEVRAELGFGDSAYLVTVRNLMPRMGLEQLVDAMAIVTRGGSEPGAAGSGSRTGGGASADRVRLIICGTGPLRESLETRIRERGLDGIVTLAGRVSDEDLVRHYQAADAFVLPTTAMEGFGISTVEALSANLPAIGTPAGATPEILNAIDPRLLTRDTTAEGIADGIISWLGWRSEDDGRTRYRDEVLAKYAWPKVVELIEGYYEEVLGAFKPAA
jgi:glycosyltransferase involved in cell wall biosynthesis